ncbi:MAG TPA: ABC transporter permease [Acidimicrobiia bacterium]|nr:ABC transporter permease [Acidimicrobiia bacterium]
MSRVVRLALPVVAALAVGAVLLALSGVSPSEAVGLVWEGAFGSAAKVSDTLMSWVPLVLAASGLVVTFTAGLWNIGVEGQIVAGAIAATWVARSLPGPGWVVVPAALLAALAGGVAWALLAGLLRTRGGVNEIFGGLGLDFVAAGLAVYLILGPWQRQGVASTSGTDVFRVQAWLPTLPNLRLSPLAIGIALAGLIGVGLLLRGTRPGLRLRAVGGNPASALVLGIPTERYLLGAFALCGALAGLAGAVQATGFHHKLVPAVSGGYGFLGILVVLLAGFRTVWIGPLALVFVAVAAGGTQLQLRLNVDSSLSGVVLGVGVLVALLLGARGAKEAPPLVEEP